MNVKKKHACEDIKTKRQQILDAAYTVFSRKGFHKTTVDEIIALADTGKGTVYNYFNNKEQLFFTLIQERSEPLYRKLEIIAQSPAKPLDKLTNMIRVHLEFMVQNADIWRVMIHELRGVGNTSAERQEKYSRFFYRIIELLKRVMDEGIAQGVVSYVDTQKAAYSLFSVVLAMVYKELVNGDIEQTANSITNLFFYGIVGQAKIDQPV